MSKGLLFWIIWLLAVISALYFSWGAWNLTGFGMTVMIMFGILGWKVFGPIVQG